MDMERDDLWAEHQLGRLDDREPFDPDYADDATEL